MKKIFFISAIYAVAIMPAKAQPSWKTSHGINLTPANVSAICKAWKLDSVEMFDVTHAAGAKEKGDFITFHSNETFSITMEGVAGDGSWKAAGVYINTVTKQPGSATETKMMFKAISIASNKLILDYQTPDLITVRYTYSPKE